MTTGASNVDADIPFAGLSVDSTWADTDLGLTEETVMCLSGRHPSVANVDPDQISTLQTEDMGSRHGRSESLTESDIVMPDIVAELQAPRLAESVGGGEGGHAEGVDIADLIDIDGLVDLGSPHRILGDDVGYLEPSGVERLRRRRSRYADIIIGRSEGGKRSKLVARHDYARMYFIGYHRDTQLFAHFAHGDEFGRRPDTPGGVVRVAEDKEFHIIIHDGGDETAGIEPVGVAGPIERALDDAAPIVADAGEKAVVDWREEEDGVARTRHCLDDCREGRHDTGSVDDTIGIDIVVAIILVPELDGVIERGRHLGVAKDRVGHPRGQSLLNFWGDGEVHVGDPHGDDIGVGVVNIPLIAAGATARERRVEVVGHRRDLMTQLPGALILSSMMT